MDPAHKSYIPFALSPYRTQYNRKQKLKNVGEEAMEQTIYSVHLKRLIFW